MAEVKYEFPGLSKFNATLIFTAMASSPLAFLTTGFLGNITFFFLKKIGRWLANQGLALLNLGVDFLMVELEQRDFENAMDEAIAKVKASKGRLTKEQKEEIDAPVKNAFRRFASFV